MARSARPTPVRSRSSPPRSEAARGLGRRQALALLALLTASACSRAPAPKSPAGPSFVGRESCAPCHARETKLHAGSRHDLAMQPANETSVLGDFADASFEHFGVRSTFFRRDGKYCVRTDGPDGKLADFEIAYTFGVYPLQQYLIPFADGCYQALSIAWDSRTK